MLNLRRSHKEPSMLLSHRIRSLAAALATLAGMLCGAAQAAVLHLSTSGDAAFVCTAIVARNDATLVPAEPLQDRIAEGDSKYFDLGPLRFDQDDPSPDFRAITLRCWLREPTEYGTVVGNNERSYSITLRRIDQLWLIADPSTGAYSFHPPRDDTVLSFELEATGDPQRAIRIVGASLNQLHNGRIVYNLSAAPYLFTRN